MIEIEGENMLPDGNSSEKGDLSDDDQRFSKTPSQDMFYNNQSQDGLKVSKGRSEGAKSKKNHS
jgi:hypothetical protein